MQLSLILIFGFFATNTIAFQPTCQPKPTSNNSQDLLNVIVSEMNSWKADIKAMNGMINQTQPEGGSDPKHLQDAINDVITNTSLLGDFGCMIDLIPAVDMASIDVDIALYASLRTFNDTLSTPINGTGAACGAGINGNLSRDLGIQYCDALGRTVGFWERILTSETGGLKDAAAVANVTVVPPPGPQPCPLYTSNDTFTGYEFVENLVEGCDVLDLDKRIVSPVPR
ncbi:hypothetical protein NHQ30_002955 [Ciborinia camelliae]|nr:hypothetical protein NHQ30_002955 [Ciborinia camelliae]